MDFIDFNTWFNYLQSNLKTLIHKLNFLGFIFTISGKGLTKSISFFGEKAVLLLLLYSFFSLVFEFCIYFIFLLPNFVIISLSLNINWDLIINFSFCSKEIQQKEWPHFYLL